MITNLSSIVNADPTSFLTSDIINDAKESQWQIFNKLATICNWTNNGVWSFMEDNWDALDADQLKADYAALLHTCKQDSNKRQVRFKNANNATHNYNCALQQPNLW